MLATGAEERPLVFGGNDRPGRDDGRRHAHLSQPLRRRARQAAGDLHQRQTAGYRTGPRPGSGRASRSPPSSTAGRSAALSPGRACAVIRSAAVVPDTRGGKALTGISRRALGASRNDRLRCACHVGRLEPGHPSRLPARRKGRSGRIRTGAFLAPEVGRCPVASPVLPPASPALADCLADGAEKAAAIARARLIRPQHSLPVRARGRHRSVCQAALVCAAAPRARPSSTSRTMCT